MGEPSPTALADDESYYQHAASVGLLRRISLRVRLNMHRFFMATFQPDATTTVLDVGVSLYISPESNVLEQYYPHLDKVVCAGIGDGTAVQQAYPGVRFVHIAPHAPLPFADGEFDIAYSNAVVEHVGSREQQRAFIHELCRVARRVFVVVPNRLFPIEHHTCLPLVHYLPLRLFRALLRPTRFAQWADESYLNPIFAGEFKSLFPPGKPVRLRFAGLGILWFRSNLIAVR